MHEKNSMFSFIKNFPLCFSRKLNIYLIDFHTIKDIFSGRLNLQTIRLLAVPYHTIWPMVLQNVLLNLTLELNPLITPNFYWLVFRQTTVGTGIPSSSIERCDSQKFREVSLLTMSGNTALATPGGQIINC